MMYETMTDLNGLLIIFYRTHSPYTQCMKPLQTTASMGLAGEPNNDITHAVYTNGRWGPVYHTRQNIRGGKHLQFFVVVHSTANVFPWICGHVDWQYKYTSMRLWRFSPWMTILLSNHESFALYGISSATKDLHGTTWRLMITNRTKVRHQGNTNV